LNNSAINSRKIIPNVTFSGYEFVLLLPYLERERPPLYSKNPLELGILQRLGSERASSRLDLAPLENCLLQCQKFHSRSYICAPTQDTVSNSKRPGIVIDMALSMGEILILRPTPMTDSNAEPKQAPSGTLEA
jgi:hypothetical protein